MSSTRPALLVSPAGRDVSPAKFQVDLLVNVAMLPMVHPAPLAVAAADLP
jgi:hypothetical protein